LDGRVAQGQFWVGWFKVHFIQLKSIERGQKGSAEGQKEEVMEAVRHVKCCKCLPKANCPTNYDCQARRKPNGWMDGWIDG